MTVDTKVPYDTMPKEKERSEPTYTKCCFVFPLRIGCFVLGYLNLAFNAIHTLVIITFTLFVGLYTHGFEDLDNVQEEFDYHVRDSEKAKYYLTIVGVVLILLSIANFVWLIVNFACLVGLHKKRPGPIRVYICLASFRLILMLGGFIYIIMYNKACTRAVITQGIDVVLTSYFIFVYYVYANQLERELRTRQDTKSEVTVAADIAFICQPKSDKQFLLKV